MKYQGGKLISENNFFLFQYLIQMIINMGMDLTLEFGWTGWSWYNGTEMAMNATDAILNVTSIIN